MQIALVAGANPMLAKAGGIRSYVVGLGQALSRMGHDVLIVGCGTGGLPNMELGVKFLSVESHDDPSSFRFLFALSWRASTLPLEGYVLHVQRPDDLVPFSLRKDLAARILTIHGAPYPGIRERHGSAVAAVYALLERVAIGDADRTIVLDSTTADMLRTKYSKSAQRIVRGTGGVDLDRFQVRSRADAKAELGLPDKPTVAYVGRLSVEKNVQLLVRVGNLIPETQIVIAGNGPLFPVLNRESALPGRTRFLGPLAHETVPTLLNAADVVALPSNRESMPAICLESLACGTPVVATRVGALPDLIRDGENGFLSEPTEEAFAAKIRQALVRSASMRELCRASVARFGWDEVARQTIEIYSKATNLVAG